MKKYGFLRFRCNICGADCETSMYHITREEPSCGQCGSTVRMRAIVHVLAEERFGESLALPDFPMRKEIKGIGMSDWHEYAKRLAESFSYTNTFYHKAPRLDITDISSTEFKGLDFIISTDVYEHIEPPVGRAFVNALALLKPGGFMVFTVPFKLQGETDEHFPNLHEYEIKDEKGRSVLYNTTKEGKTEQFTDLVFHGGPGSTLEMRVFSRIGIHREFLQAGFKQVQFCTDSYFEHGIFWRNPSGVPIVARTKPKEPAAATAAKVSVDSWGPTQTCAGRTFNLQPNGSSALWVKGRGFEHMRRLVFGEWDLKATVTRAGTMLSAEVPPHLIAAPGPVMVELHTVNGESITLGRFQILPED